MTFIIDSSYLLSFNTTVDMMPFEYISKPFIPYLCLLDWPFKCFVSISRKNRTKKKTEIERTCTGGEEKGTTATPTSNGDMSMNVYIRDRQPIIHSWQRKERKKNLVLLLRSSCWYTRKTSNIRKHILSLSFYSLCILLLHRNVDDNDGSISKRKKKKKNTKKMREKKERHMRRS
jgi:hypothetical protein